ncbi:hypothetical protein GCM10023214_45700 [Amycolatopsis dongchuanensis]|uniref:Uncharacterized protein n=1 Tax=Amycolatopsis dongchuanensis TaxID=1070866 RepID=A0ABP9QXY3_9PSEU
MTAGAVATLAVMAAVRHRERAIKAGHVLLVVSLVSATIALLTVRCGLSPTLCVPSSFLATAVPLTVLDAKTRRLPNWLLGIGYGLLLAAAAAAGSASRDFVSPL